MTEQEAVVWVARMERIWGAEKVLLAEHNRVEGFTWRAQLKSGPRLHSATYRSEILFDLCLEKEGGKHDESLVFDTQYNRPGPRNPHS